jgi:uncharacterized protein YecE (DUF72 family)
MPSAADARWHLGTMGFSFPDWTGPFYPRGVEPRRRLELYATCFDTVELDTTFHAIPRPEIVARWAAATPDGFRFTAKAPRAVTHGGDLAHLEARDEMQRFLEVITGLGPKLAVVLLQFPPHLTDEHLGELAVLLASLPESVRYAVEFRHESWWNKEAVQLLRDRDVAWVIADEPSIELASLPPFDEHIGAWGYRPRPIIVTTDFIYVRWLGRHEQFPDLARERLDPTARLAWWAQRLTEIAGPTRPVRTVYGLFNNGYAGHSPGTCRRFLRLTGREVPMVPADAGQGSLFE